MFVEDECESTIVGAMTAELHETSRVGRQRKAPTIFDNFVDDKSMRQEMMRYSSVGRKTTVKKRSLVDSGVASEAKKIKSSTVIAQRKTKAPVVVVIKEPVLSVREKDQLRIEEEFISMHKVTATKSQCNTSPLPVGPSKPMEMSAAIKKGVKECSKLLLDCKKPAAKLVGSICKVFWDGENEWFYARILNYDSGHNRHYVRYTTIISSVLWLLSARLF